MAVGDLLLAGALALAGAATASAVLGLATGRATAERRAVRLGLAAFALAALAFLVLLGHFLARDYSIYYVWNYTDDATPLYLRVAGTWAGAAGSVFLWTVMLGAVFAIEELLRRRASARGQLTGGAMPGVARAVILATFGIFLFLTITSKPFAPTADYHLDGESGFFTYQPGHPELPTPLDFRAQGFGLNPLLQTPFMAIHPPMEFAAYASVAMPFAFAVAFALTRDKAWWGGALLWARVSWMFYAIAIGLGALWAYYVLSFGGYWAWDPVEVGDLVPFLGLTAFLHAADMHRKGTGYPHYAPFLASLLFPLTLFGTFVTRSSYWISAHAFDVGSAAIINDPAQRLVAIVEAKPQVAQFLSLLFVVLASVAALYLLRLARDLAKRSKLALAVPALAVLAAYLAVMMLAALDVQGFLRQGFALASLAGRGDLLLGLALLGLAFVAVPVVVVVASIEDEGEPKPLDPRALLQPDALMSVGVILLSLGLLVTAAILVVGVNFTVTQLGELFKAREPLIALPIVFVLTMRLSVKALGGPRSAALALSALAVGAMLYLALPPGLKLLGLGVPMMSVALAAALSQLLRAAQKGSTAPSGTQRAGALILLASLCGFAMWASPPSVLLLGPVAVAVPLSLVPVGLGAAMLAYLVGVAVVHGRGGPRALLLGSLAAMVGVGYGLGVALGLGALALGWRARGAMKTQPLAAALRGVKGRLHGTSRWAAHVGILLVFIGYGASAYHATEHDFHDLSDPLQRGVPVEVAELPGYRLTLVDSRGTDADRDGRFEVVTAFVAVERGGRLLETADLSLYWVDKENQYRPTEHVLRGPLEDLYLNSDPSNLPAFHTAEDGWVVGNQQTQFDRSGAPRKMQSDAVDMLSLSVKRLPLVAPLWTGAALLPFTMAVTILTAPPRGFAKPVAAPAPQVVTQPAPAAPVPSRAERPG